MALVCSRVPPPKIASTRFQLKKPISPQLMAPIIASTAIILARTAIRRTAFTRSMARLLGCRYIETGSKRCLLAEVRARPLYPFYGASDALARLPRWRVALQSRSPAHAHEALRQRE